MSSANMIDVETTSEANLPTRKGRGMAVMSWALFACILLSSAGVVRGVQDRRHQTETAYKETCPFDLVKMPDHFGADWKLAKGGVHQLDEMTMKITGGTDHFVRTYSNETTGVSVTILLLFGPAGPVMPHTPQVCYPATGFAATEVPLLRTVSYSLGKDAAGKAIVGKAEFLSGTYARPNGRQVRREAVYHSFRLDGQWSPYVGQGRKFPRRNPGVFKLQIHRMVIEGESVEQGDPIEQFLQLFLAELEAEIKASGAPSSPLAAG